MTSKERIDAAIAARDKATPGPFEVVFRGTLGMYSVRKTDGSVHKQLAYCGFFDASLFAAAPDLADEVIRLRKWQEEALPYLNLASARLMPKPLDFIRFNDAIDDIDRLIAEAEGE